MQESVAHVPHARLRPYVAGMVGYFGEGLPVTVHRGLPSPYLTLVVTIDDPLEVLAHPDPVQTAGRYDTLVGGLHIRPALLVRPERQAGVQLNLTPLGARGLLGVPASALASVDVELADLLGPLAGELADRVRTATTWSHETRRATGGASAPTGGSPAAAE